MAAEKSKQEILAAIARLEAICDSRQRIIAATAVDPVSAFIDDDAWSEAATMLEALCWVVGEYDEPPEDEDAENALRRLLRLTGTERRM